MGDWRIPGGRTGNQDAAGSALKHSGQHGQRQVMHGDDIELYQGAFAFWIQLCNRTDGGDPGVGTQNRDISRCQFVCQLGPLDWVDEIERPHLNRDLVLIGQSRSQVVECVFSTRGDDEVVPACGQFGR
jgi:hypothetical protein